MKKTLTQQLADKNIEIELLTKEVETVKLDRDTLKVQLSEVFTKKDTEMKNVLIMIGRQFGLDPYKMKRTQYGMNAQEPKTVPELAGEIAGMMGQLLEDKRVTDARSEEREKEISWLRGTFHLVLGIEEKVEITGDTKHELEKPTKL